MSHFCQTVCMLFRKTWCHVVQLLKELSLPVWSYCAPALSLCLSSAWLILLTCSLHPSSSPLCVPATLGCTASWVQLRPCQNPIWNVSSTSLESNGFHWTELWPAVCRQSVTYWWSRTPYVAFQIKWYKECDSVEKHLSLAIFSTLH